MILTVVARGLSVSPPFLFSGVNSGIRVSRDANTEVRALFQKNTRILVNSTIFFKEGEPALG